MKRKSFVRYESFYKAIKRLPPENAYNASMFIMEYGLFGKNPKESVDPIAYVVFLLIQPQIDANNKRYVDGQKGGKYGVLGGRPEKNWDNLQKPHRGKNNNPTGGEKITPNVNVNVNENVNANGNVNENVNENLPIIIKEEVEEKKIKNKKVHKKIEYSDLFESFRKVYPKKKGKQQAREAWQNAIKGGNDPDLLIKKAEEYATEIKLKRKEERYIKFAQGRLNEGRYDDDYFTGNNGIKPNLDDLY